MTSLNGHNLRVISLRTESDHLDQFESGLRNAGHKVTVLSSTEPAFALVNSNWPDMILFNPVSQFGMSGSVQRLRSSYNGPIVATGIIPDPTIGAMLNELGITLYAEDLNELFDIVQITSVRTHRVASYDVSDFDRSSVPTPINDSIEVEDRQLSLAEISKDPAVPDVQSVQPGIPATVLVPRSPRVRRLAMLKFKTPSLGTLRIKNPLQRWQRPALGIAAVAAVIIAVTLPFFGNDQIEEPVARALPVVPRLLTEPLAPLTLEELSGEILPLEIAGINDQTVIEEAAVAFWGDTAPDAFVTVNGEPVDVSAYGAFVVDYPLEDGANYIEILASDFQGRTSRRSFTVVSLQ